MKISMGYQPSADSADDADDDEIVYTNPQVGVSLIHFNEVKLLRSLNFRGFRLYLQKSFTDLLSMKLQVGRLLVSK